MTPQEALAYLYSQADFERGRSGTDYDLRRVEHLLRDLGDPHLGRLTIHLAGTKGKGSSAAMAASVLQAAGYHTGLFTSPHLCDFRERIRVDGRAIPAEAFAETVKRVQAAADRYHQDPEYGRLTTFELTTTAAFVHFRDQDATAQILEAGLGGRLDATNVIPTPEVAVITPISYDHVEILGETLAAIAGEKAGIIKPGGAVVMGPQESEAGAVIARRCYEVGAVLVDAGRHSRWDRTAFDLDGQSFHLTTAISSYDLRIPLLGAFQIENAAVAVAAYEVLRSRGVPLKREHLEQGLAQVRWPGRLQVVQRNPLVVLDGAHNGASARRLREALTSDIGHQRLILVVGVSADKDLDAIAAELGPIADEVIATRADNPRSADPATIGRAFCARITIASVPEALTLGLAHASPEDLVCVTGSLYVVGEALKTLGLAPDVFDLRDRVYA